MRTTSGTLSTDYTFTGQKLDASTGLMYYGARYYDAAIGRFAQPDSIVPNPYNPQSLNRYSYTLNNPVKYTDPSGHSACVDEDCDVQFNPITDELMAPNGIDAAADSILGELGGTNDLEAMALMADILASVYDGWDQILPEMSQIFNGTKGYGPFSLAQAGLTSFLGGGCGGIGRETHDCPGNEGRPQFSDKGFHNDFKDGHNQPFHAWGYIAQTAVPGSWVDGLEGVLFGVVGNVVHEPMQSALSGGNGEGLGWGTSWQDYVLSDKAMGIGLAISAGNVSPAQLGDIMRQVLGPQGPGSNGRLNDLITNYGRLAGSPK